MSARWTVNNFGKLKGMAREALAAAVEDMAQTGEKYAVDAAEQQGIRDTGALIDEDFSNKMTGEFSAQYSNDAAYAGYQELGTKRNAARPFMEPSMLKLDGQKERIIRAHWAAQVRL